MSLLSRDPLAFKHKSAVTMRWSDLDELAHVNNAVFLTYIEEARIRYLVEAVQWDWKKEGIIVGRIEIDYLAPLLYPYPAFAYTRCSKLGTKSFDLEYLITSLKNGKETPVAAAKTIMVSFDYATNASQVLPQSARDRFIAFEGESLIGK